MLVLRAAGRDHAARTVPALGHLSRVRVGVPGEGYPAQSAGAIEAAGPTGTGQTIPRPTMEWRRMSVKAQHTCVVDWDGTAVPGMWPKQSTEFMPGFTEAMFQLHEAGLHIIIDSARLSPLNPGGRGERDPALVFGEMQYVRNMLDNAGLTFIDIWTGPGKPTGFVYVDDRAERYHGRKGSWKAMVVKILARASVEKPLFPAMKARTDA